MEHYGVIKIYTMNMTCKCKNLLGVTTQLCECPSGDLVNPPPLLVASSYIQLVKNRTLYQQYRTANPTLVVCNKKISQPIRYRSYQLKQSIERGCWYDQLYCGCNCPNLTCKLN
jgi:hypothetical protein